MCRRKGGICGVGRDICLYMTANDKVTELEDWMGGIDAFGVVS